MFSGPKGKGFLTLVVKIGIKFDFQGFRRVLVRFMRDLDARSFTSGTDLNLFIVWLLRSRDVGSDTIDERCCTERR